MVASWVCRRVSGNTCWRAAARPQLATIGFAPCPGSRLSSRWLLRARHSSASALRPPGRGHRAQLAAAGLASQRPVATVLLATIGSCVISYHVASGLIDLWTGGGDVVDDSNGGKSQETSSEVWNPSWADHAECSGEMPADLWDEMLELRKASDPQVGVRHVLFVRHAQGMPDSPETTTVQSAKADAQAVLSEVGRKQVQLTAKRLCDLFEEVDAVYHSGAPIDKATAKVFHKEFSKDIQSAPRLVETGLLSEAVPVLPSPRPAALSDDSLAEKLQDHAARAECAFHAFVWPPRCDKKHRDLASTEIVVGPGNLLRFLTCRAIQLPKQAWSRMAASHCTVTWLEIRENGEVVLREFGGSGHMPAELWTYY